MNCIVEGKLGCKGVYKVIDFNNIMKMSIWGMFVYDFELKGGNLYCFLVN